MKLSHKSSLNRFRFEIPIFLFFLIPSCSLLLSPGKSVKQSSNLSNPEYSNLNHWAVHPQKKTNASNIPENSGLKDEQQSAPVDVFFIHPTSYLKGSYWNADINDAALNNRTDERIVKNQISVYNGCCRIYAPRYRQAIIYSFFNENDKNGEEALEFAYADVLNSFHYYMKTWNQGRPWILASHSQGTRHAVKLLQYIKNSEYSKNLIVSYIIGFPFSTENTGFPTCVSPTDTKCVINWNTFLKGHTPFRMREKYAKSVCVNPLNWKSDNSHAEENLHLGGLNSKFSISAPRLTDAKCENGILLISEPKEKNFPSLPNGNYHILDYSLFYMNIRKNLEERILAYKKGN